MVSDSASGSVRQSGNNTESWTWSVSWYFVSMLQQHARCWWFLNLPVDLQGSRVTRQSLEVGQCLRSFSWCSSIMKLLMVSESASWSEWWSAAGSPCAGSSQSPVPMLRDLGWTLFIAVKFTGWRKSFNSHLVFPSFCIYFKLFAHFQMILMLNILPVIVGLLFLE